MKTTNLAVFFIFIAIAPPVLAVRPFITDDARVLERNYWQIETSLRIDRLKFQNLNLFAYGITQKLEATLGFLDGYYRKYPAGASVAGPLVQLKYLFLPSKPLGWPGIAVALGANFPYGAGGLKPDFGNEFIFLALTETIFDNERWLWHFNLGVSVNHAAQTEGSFPWGIGTQIRIFKGLCLVEEILSGDPYSSAKSSGGVFQTGFRYILNDRLQIDATAGFGLWGDPKPDAWIGLGLRTVFGPIIKKD